MATNWWWILIGGWRGFGHVAAPAEVTLSRGTYWRHSTCYGGYWSVGDTGYGCHTFNITDVFRNIVNIADIRLVLCLNIVSCAHINMQFVIFIFLLLKKRLRVWQLSPCWGCLSQHMGLVVTRCDTACRRRISYSPAVRAGDYFIFKLKFLLYLFIYLFIKTYLYRVSTIQ